MNGVILLGKVVKVYPLNHSADVQLMNNQYGSLISPNSNNGKYSCRIMESTAGFNESTGLAYGTSNPLQVGNLVIIGFINNHKSQPVILGCMHNSHSRKNIMADESELWNSDEINRKSVISRLGDYFTINGSGEWEIAHHSGAFITAKSSEFDSDLEWDDLQLGSKVGDPSSSNPLNILAKMRTLTGKIRLFVNGFKGVVQLVRTSANTLSMIEIDENGTIRLKTQPNSSKAIEIFLSPQNNSITLQQSSGGNHSKVMLSDNGVSIDSSLQINIYNTKKMNLSSSSSISIDAPHVHISVDD